MKKPRRQDYTLAERERLVANRQRLELLFWAVRQILLLVLLAAVTLAFAMSLIHG